MAYFQRVGTCSDWQDASLYGIGGLAVHGSGAALRVYSASGGQGGVVVRDPGAGLAITGQAGPAAGGGWAGLPGVDLVTLAGRAALVSHGQGAGATGYWIGADGALSAPFALPVGGGTVLAFETVALGGQDLILTSTLQGRGVASHLRGADGRITPLQQIPLGSEARGYDVQDIAVLQKAGQSYLLAVSAGADRLSVFRLGSDGLASLTETLGPADGLYVDAPNLIETVRMGGHDYVLIGAAGTGSVSVAEMGTNGRLTILDQVNDDLTTRFAGISVLKAVTVGDRVFVIAGGADDGLSLMALLPGGRLLHLETIADSLDMPLDNVAALAARAAGGAIDLFVAGSGEAGLGHLRIDPGPLAPTLRADNAGATLSGDARGDLILGGPGADRLSGGAGADILTDGAGADLLWGGAGADVFVFTPDGETDTVMDFDPAEDQLDLSALGWLYSRAALQFTVLANGIEILAGEERIRLFSADGRPIEPARLSDAALFDLWHVGPMPLPDPDRSLTGTDLSDMLLGKEGNDTLAGLRGADWLQGGAGNDILNGETADPGFDATAAQVCRLFRATLGRAPNPDGLLAWVDVLESGRKSLGAVIDGFVDSREFLARYGATTDAGFVTLLYANVLGRAPKPEGLTSWTEALASGRLDRAEVVQGFAESAEFRARTAPEALALSRAGLQADWADDVYRLYQATLDRAPKPEGLCDWAMALAEGRPFLDVVTGFVTSREFLARYGATTDAGFVTLLYANVLGRAPKPEGLAAWTEALASGRLDRAEVVQSFVQGREFVAATAPGLAAFLRALGEGDRLDGGAGSNLLFGGIGADSFVFDRAAGGVHQVADLEPWDRIELHGFGYADAGAAFAHMSQAGGDTVFADQGVRIVFCGTALAGIHADMVDLWA